MSYNKEQQESIFNDIINNIIEGYSVRSILRRPNMPTFVTLLKWIEEDERKMKQYTRAKEESADTDADHVNDIAQRVLTKEVDPASARVAIDAYKWSAGKKKPKKYGDKIDVTTNQESLNKFPSLEQFYGKVETSDE